MRTFHDSVNAGNIPAGAVGVCGYIDGLYVWSTADWARFPNAVKVRIAISSYTNDGHVLDCEWGDATPDQCPAWVVMRRAAGADPSVYCTESNWPLVRAAFVRTRVTEPHYWIAAYPGIGRNLYPGAVAHQWWGGMTTPFDLNVVADYWPGVDSKPVPPKPIPPVSRKATLDMFITYTRTQHYLIVGGSPHVIATPADESAYRVAGVPVILLTVAELAAYGIK
jgi:hypothetical protein